MLSIEDLIENKIKLNKKYFCTIIGSNPSKGARSPKLWNYTYKKMDIGRKMIALDLKKNNLKKLLLTLKHNDKFIGSAVTNPYKEEILKFKLIKLNSIERDIGAINCFYRYKKSFLGINTDGIAAIDTLNKNKLNLKNKKILLLGCGGAGKAIASYISSKIYKKNNLIISVRKKSKIKKLSKKLNCNLIDWEKRFQYLSDVDIVINATSLGNINNLQKTPINKSSFKKFKKNTFFFDINYQPRKTLFLKYADESGFRFCNGLHMNLSQAVIAFNVVNKINSKYNKTYNLMRKVK